ncbi:MAG: carboxylesterase/lipase family protein, partial [Parasporobacterium sp.]|nr:carboxylesterase/lipase family protein [Parasporobacterium sp.]
MKKFTKVFAIVLSVVLSALTVSVMAAPIENTEPVTAKFVTTTGGEVMGYRYDGVDTFFAIPYGTAERFQPATPASWEGIYCANVVGEASPMSASPSDKSRDLFNCFPYNMLEPESEEKCMNLNVWSASVEEGSRPVIVWFHGGGLTGGSATQFRFYMGESMAKERDVVFVSVNGRLNCLGFMDLSAYGEEYKYSGNVGIMDLQLALEWVRDNIASFGGDPSNVTIIGQSGGGTKVTSLMSAPSAKGLFHKAAALSGGTVNVTRTTEEAQADTANVVALLGIEEDKVVETLTTMPYDELYTA